MEKPFRILVAENDEILAKTAQEFLELQGYAVFTADTPEKAKDFLENNWVHLAVVDMRLRDDNSGIDKSGIDLLKTTAREVPKLIWTAYTEEFQDVRTAMKADAYRLPPAVDFVAKKAGLPELGEAVAEALVKYMPLNKNLQVAWRSFLSFPQLTEMIVGDNGRLPHGALVTELEDLFCLLFPSQPDFEIAQITIDKVIISGAGYVILGIYAFKTDGAEIPYVVTFGKPAIVKKEAQLFKTAVPRPIKTSNLSKSQEVETTHFAATAYRLVEGHLDTITPFSRFYQQNEMTIIEKSLNNLFRGNLVQWYKQGRESKTLAEMDKFYKTIYQTAKTEDYPDWFHRTFSQICKKMQAVGFGQAKIADQKLQFLSGLNNSRPFATPLTLLKKIPTLTEPVQWGRIHGKVGTKTILVDHLAHTWLIDFTQVSQGPLLHDFTHLEIQIKMHLLERHSLEALYDFEQQLINDADENIIVPTAMGKATELIRVLRNHAAYVTRCTLDLYLLSLYYQGLNHLLAFENSRFYTQAELQPFVHLLLSTSMVATAFLEKEVVENNLPETAVSGLFIDEEKRQVFVDGRLITNLSHREYRLLLYFKQHKDQTRSRREIVLEGFQEDNYDEFTDRDRVNNAIKRLREKIEPEPQNPQFIITVPGQGYQFNSTLLDR